MACVVCEQPLRQQNEICPECVELLAKTSRLYDPTLTLYSRDWHKMRVLGSYEGLLATLISRAKFGARPELLIHLTDLLSHHLQNSELSGLSTIANLPMTSVPLPFGRRFHRGFNQSELIMQRLGKQLGNDINHQMLFYKGTSRVQHLLNKQQRISNRQHVFCSKGKIPKRLIVVDDIITTGATMAAVCQQLKAAGAEYIEVWALALTPK